MRKTIFKFVSILAVFGFLLVGCGGSTGTTGNNEELIPPDGTHNETEILSDIADAPINEDIDYYNMFSGVDTEGFEILALAEMNENLSIFSNLMDLTILDFQMEFGEEPVTAFIPTNAAFKEMPEEQFEYLLDPQNRQELRKFLKRHIIPTEVPSIQFENNQIIETVSEEEITIGTGMGDLIYVGGAEIVKADVKASNGIIHIVNSIIEPTKDVVE